jgi:PPOX class probable F420-dependent enzyme
MLNARTKELCEGANFAALTTLFVDGDPQTQVMWVGCDDDHVLINTEIHRAKFRNVERDPRVTVMIWDAETPYSYVEVRGRVVETIRGDAARADIDQLAQKYMGTDYPNEITSERVILRIAPDRELVH